MVQIKSATAGISCTTVPTVVATAGISRRARSVTTATATTATIIIGKQTELASVIPIEPVVCAARTRTGVSGIRTTAGIYATAPARSFATSSAQRSAQT